MPQTILFDVDGTLIDTVDLHTRAWLDALRRFGFDPAYADVRAQIGKGGDQLLPVFVPAGEIDAKGKAIEALRGEIFERDYLPSARPFPGVRALFERVRTEGQTLAVASSSKAEELERYLQICDVADLVDLRTSSDDAAHSKPCPDIFQAALRKLEIDGEQAVVVGDTPYDAQAASAAGIRAVGVLSGGFAEADLRQGGCVEIYQDAADLLARYAASALAPFAARS